MLATYLRPNTTESAPNSPQDWLNLHGDYLFSYAKLRLRDDAAAEEAVQETLLAALESQERYPNQSSERTWLVGILKHKIIDHYRMISRTREISSTDDERHQNYDPFQSTGKWLGHWRANLAPTDWELDAAATLEKKEFWETLGRCLSDLPQMRAVAFTLREIDGLSSDEVCEVLNLSPSKLKLELLT